MCSGVDRFASHILICAPACSKRFIARILAVSTAICNAVDFVIGSG